MQETQVWSLDQEDNLEEEMATHLPEKSHGQRSLSGYSQSGGSQRIGHDIETKQQTCEGAIL